jgi:hypothetical protein
LKCFNCYSEFLPTLSKSLCQECGLCYYCRDYFSCVHYDADNKEYNRQQEQQQEQQQQLLPQSPGKNQKKNNQKNWDSYNDLVSTPTIPALENSAAVIVIDESLSRKIGKFHILELIQKLTSPQMNCFVDIIPTGTSDNYVIKVFNSYTDIPALILTSDKGLSGRLRSHSLFVKSKKGSNAIRVIIQAVKYRISRL